MRFRRFAFVAYGTLYGYAGLSARLLDALGSPTLAPVYFVVTGSLVVIASSSWREDSDVKNEPVFARR